MGKRVTITAHRRSFYCWDFGLGSATVSGIAVLGADGLAITASGQWALKHCFGSLWFSGPSTLRPPMRP